MCHALLCFKKKTSAALTPPSSPPARALPTHPSRPPTPPPRHPAGVILASVFCIPLILWLYRKTLLGPVPRFEAVLDEVKDFRVTDWDLFAKCCEYGGVAVAPRSRSR